MINISRQHCILVTIILLILSFSTRAQTATHKTPFDFDGDSKTDLAVWRPADGTWYIFQSLTQTSRFETFGLSTDKIVPGDYDGDGKTDLAVFRLSNNTWYVLKSTNGAVISQQWGLNGDLPVAGDYDGDGKTDFAVFRPQDNTWQILKSSNGGYTTLSFGGIGDVPVRGDFDGDGKADFAVWRPGTGYWYYINSSDTSQALQFQQWGMGSLGDTVGAGDYDGDGKTDLAVWRSSNGYWYVLKSSGGTISQQFGSGPNGDVPVPGNYDGDLMTDFAVWRVPTGTWYTLKSSNNTTTAQAWGSQAAGDKLAPSAFIPTGAVAGTISTRTGAAISGALVEVFDQGVFKTAVASGSTGYFSAGGVLTGKYELRVSANGYKDVRLTGINVVAGGTTTSNVSLAEQTVLLEDSFNDNCILGFPASTCSSDTMWEAGLIGEAGNSTISVAEMDQRLRVTIPCSGSPTCQTQSNIFNGVRSINSYDLRDAYVSVRVVEPAGQSDGLETRLDVGISSVNKLQFMVSGGGTTYVRKTVDNITTELVTPFPFSSVTMAYIRIRFKPDVDIPSQSKIYFETSPTGADGTWTVRNDPDNQVFNDFSLSSVKVSLNTGTYNSVTGVHKAVFDDFKFAKYSTALAKAGEDKSLTLGGTVSLDGSNSTSEGGTISTYKWTFTSKPSGAPDPAISSSTSATTGITGLTFVGYYNFQLTVTDSLNSVSTDTVRLYVAEAPVARISAPTTITEDEPIVFDGSFSSGAYEVEWDFGDGRQAEISRATHLYMTPGTYTVTLKVTNEAGATAPGFPAAIATFQVTVGLLDEATNFIDFPTNLQAAINSANGYCGGTDITLQHGVDYGSITLPTRADGCNGYIRVLSDNLNSLPPKGTRISENDIANMPRVTTQTSDAAMKTNAAAHHYRFIGILFRRGPNNNAPVYTLVSLGVPEETQQVASNTPHHFVFDRCIFSNIAFPENSTSDKRIQRGLQLHSGSTSVINSHFREFKCDCDAQAIVSWSGLGPHAIINNYLESATEIVMYGGASMRIPYATPSDISIRGNYFFKPVR